MELLPIEELIAEQNYQVSHDALKDRLSNNIIEYDKPETIKRKVFSDGGHFLMTPYVYDDERRAYIDLLFEQAEKRAYYGDWLYSYIRNGYIDKYGFTDYYMPQLDDVISRKLRKRKEPKKTIYDDVFDYLFFESFGLNLRDKKQIEYIKAGLIDNFGENGFNEDIEFSFDAYIVERIKRKYNNYFSRYKRFQRKAFINKFNYFVHLTWNPAIHTEETFRKKLKKTLANFATRRGWKYMGVFELSPEKKRLHFHALVYVPPGQMVGKIEKVMRFDEKEKRQKESDENSFFKKQFGINEFQLFDDVEISWKNIANSTVSYILKYMVKTDEKVVYSRAIPDFFFKDIREDDIVAPIKKGATEFIVQYVLFDDILDDEDEQNEESDYEPPED